MPLRFKDEGEFEAWRAAARGRAAPPAQAAPSLAPPVPRGRRWVLPSPTADDARLAAHALARVVLFLLRALVVVALTLLQLVAAAAQAVLAVLLLVNVAARLGHGRCGGH